MNKTPKPEDIVLWQVSGALIGAAGGVAAVTCSYVFISQPLAVVLAFFVPAWVVVGGVAGMLWGSSRKREYTVATPVFPVRSSKITLLAG
jgi:hypothetical protein